MTDKSFEEIDKKMMNMTKALREKEVSEGILKGFSASVERRILADEQPSARRSLSPAWVPALAVMVLASIVVLRSPMGPALQEPSAVDYARLDAAATRDLEEDIATLKEVGAWSDDDDSILGTSDGAIAQELELSSGPRQGQTNIA